ncbi:tail fiber assembly protein [Enterobacter cloacae]|uniref:tail fiber assembly protein n=1 Tax=Enterobacter cloacae TaxID=550 RepID=UPI001D08D90F|nr:tail fiber assembly protein [Enterobacter cloacae]MCK6711126.1 tail fiber assembly protein [Enterobacter cloacae]HAS1141130.1 tail fiber assembly protein [Enterobacter cloacae]
MAERIFYSAKNNGFYPYSLIDEYRNAGNIPGDLVEITERWHEYLLDGQSRGRIISPDEYGSPVLSDPPEPTKDELISAAEAQKQRLLADATAAVAPLQDAVDLGMATETEIARLHEWKKYRVHLNRVDTTKTTDIEWPELPED